MVITERQTTESGFRVGFEPDASVLWLTGEHDLSTLHALRLMLVDLIAADRDITVDLSEVTFVGTAVIGELERARQHLVDRDRWLTVRSPSCFVRRTFRICRAARLFDERPRA